MGIVFGADIGINPDAFDNMAEGVIDEYSRVIDGLTDNFNRLAGKTSGLASPLRAETVYVDDGFQNVPGTVFPGAGNIGDFDDVQTRRITNQTPQATVYIKKRLFSSLRSEHDTRFMDAGEKAFIRSSKLLFERKCLQIAAYESMTKLEGLLEEESELDIQRVELIKDVVQNILDDTADRLDSDAKISAINALDFLGTDAIFTITESLNKQKEKFESASEALIAELDKIIKEVRVSKQEIHTSWVIDSTADVDRAKVGRGVGVIELTLIDSVRTSLSIEYNDQGSITLSVQDPYNLTLINSADIELALSAATGGANKDKFGIQSENPQSILEEARQKEDELKRTRSSRLSSLTLGLMDSTSPLSGTNLSEIIFEINPSSQASHKVVGRFSGLSTTFNVQNFALVSSQMPADQRLSIKESILVGNVFALLEKYITAINRISGQNNKRNSDPSTTYARKQLRKNYLGKSIIQPMDGVNVYIRSNTFKDGGIEGPLSSLINSSPFVKSFATNSDVTESVLKEEMRQFGIKNVPVGVYKNLRTDSLLRNAGTHVFGGLINSVTKSYSASSGQYTLNVSGKSNLRWLNLSKVNVSPSLDQPRGVLEDPITPLEIKTDPSTGLIVGVPRLSSDNVKRLGSLYYKSGVYEGKQVSETNMGQDVKVLGDQAFTVRQHAPGLVYKWKEGVISVTQQKNLRTALDGSTPQIDSIRRDVGITITQSPFANLDIANVISLMVTGFPHNYETFVLNSQSVGSYTLGLDDNVPESFFGSLMDITRTNNRALGNFEAFKPITITRKQMADRLSLQTDLIKYNKELATLMESIAKLQDLVNQMSTNALVIKAELIANLKTAKENLETKQAFFASKINQGENNGLRIYGNDIVIDDNSPEETDANSRLRSKLMQIRPQVATKLNRDRSLFIVSDEYDKDLDLQAFVTNLASGEIPIWNSEYKHPIEICVNAAKVIDFELFCDTMGNIQFRPPQYNKIPISLLSKMLLLKKEKGIDIVPPFIRALFKNKRNALEDTSDVLDIDIKINNLLLFGDEFRFKATSRGDSRVTFSKDSNDILISKDSVVTGSQADISKKIKTLTNKKAAKIGTKSVGDDSEELKEIEKNVSELNNPSTPNVNTRRQKIINDLLIMNSQKERVEETIAKMEANDVKEQKFNSIIANESIGFDSELSPGRISTILEPFGNLLEDDSNDFLGPGSASRFIIKDEDIISYDFKESDDSIFCRVDVTGQEDFIGGNAGNIAGVPVIWAGATDFDLWKQYGWRAEQAISKPFFKDAESQCAPYALMLLARQRKDIVRASLTVTGNEYYQLGDVVYINSVDLLYYVYGISHNFSYSGGSFTTVLDLRYGHPPGEFIPTPLDVIGKNIIKNQKKFNTTFMFRSVAGADIGRTLGTITFVPTETNDVDQAKSQMLDGDIGAVNLIALKNSLLLINRFKDTSSFDKIEIRGWVRNNDQVNKISSRVSAVRDWLARPIEKFAKESGSDFELDSEVFVPIGTGIINALDPILMGTGDDFRLDKENIGKTPSEESYNFMQNPEDKEGEFSTIEIVLMFKKQ